MITVSKMACIDCLRGVLLECNIEMFSLHILSDIISEWNNEGLLPLSLISPSSAFLDSAVNLPQSPDRRLEYISSTPSETARYWAYCGE